MSQKTQMEDKYNYLRNLFENYFRYVEEHTFKETNAEDMKLSILSALQPVTQKDKKVLLQQMTADFEKIAQITKEAYNSMYGIIGLHIEETKAKKILSLDEVILTYKVTKDIKKREWRDKHTDFPYHQASGKGGKIYTYEEELQEWLKTQK